MIKLCIDKTVISKIINHQDVRDWLIDDNSSADNAIVIHPSITYLVDANEQGVIRVDPMNSIAGYVHIATTSKMWGSGHEFVEEAITWGFKHLSYLKYVAFVPAYNEYTINLVKDVGFKQEGILTKSFLKNWKLHDQLMFGLSKGDL